MPPRPPAQVPVTFPGERKHLFRGPQSRSTSQLLTLAFAGSVGSCDRPPSSACPDFQMLVQTPSIWPNCARHCQPISHSELDRHANADDVASVSVTSKQVRIMTAAPL